MRLPVLSFAALVTLLGANVVLGHFLPPHAAFAEVAVTFVQVLVVLLVSMEVLEEPPLLRFFSALGFLWVVILFAMTIVDYATR
jgi:cytochrome c oxidase subunit 4